MKRAAYLILVGLQVLSLAIIIARRVHLLRTGERVMLRCVPLDPRSLLSGDYVQLRFSLSRFTHEKWPKVNRFHETFEPGETIYVGLQRPPGETHHRPAAVSHDLSRLRPGWPLVMRGTVRSVIGPAQAGGWIEVQYGVEDYFVPQDQGQLIERRIRETSVEVALSAQGESAIRRLLIDGKEVRFH